MSTQPQDSTTSDESTSWLPYGRHSIDPIDTEAVVEVLRSNFLTTGPKVEEFEEAMASYTGARYGVAVNSGTAALHTMLSGFGIGPGDEVIVPSITFAATATAVCHAGATPVFADVDPDSILLGTEQVQNRLSKKTKAVIAVDFAGQACDYSALRDLLKPNDVMLFSDGCHALGGSRDGDRVGNLADATTFSFHPVKHITTGEGGMVLTHSESAAQKMKRFRNHGITVTHQEREQQGGWFYEIAELGMNYRLSDLQCAIGIAQLSRLEDWMQQRQQVARLYDQLLADVPGVTAIPCHDAVSHAYHLYVVRIDREQAGFSRDDAFAHLRANHIGVNVHYIPVHLHPYFRKHLGTGPGLCPQAEKYYAEALSLPIFPSISDQEVKRVVETLSQTSRYQPSTAK